MAASQQTAPSGSINHIGADYISPKTASGDIIFATDKTAATEWASLDNTNQQIKVDTIAEFTTASGVTIDGVLVKDSSIRVANNTSITGRNAANSADVSIARISASDQLEFPTTINEAGLTFSQPLQLARGGTGGTDAATARTGLGLGSLSTLSTVNNSNWSGTALAVANGGTGATTASAARTALGLGALAVEAAVNNSLWSGTDLSVANGGTGSSTASDARTALGVAIGTDVQAFDSKLTDIAALSHTNNYFTVSNGTTFTMESPTNARTSLGLGSLATASTISDTDWSGTDLAIVNGGTGSSTASGARTNLGLGSLSTLSTINDSNWSGTALAVANGGTGSTSATAARSALGLGSIAVQSTIDNGDWSGTDLSVANGGTGSSSSSGARSNLGAAASGSNSDITALTNCSTISDNGVIEIYTTNNSALKFGVISGIVMKLDGTDFSPITSGGANLGTPSLPWNGFHVNTINFTGSTGTPGSGTPAGYVLGQVGGVSRYFAYYS